MLQSYFPSGNISGMAKYTNRLRVVRAERRMTQRTLATKTRISTSRISFIENGIEAPTDAEQRRIARALKTDVHVVFPVPAQTPAPAAEVASV